MSTNVNDIICKLAPSQRKKTILRAAEFLSDEMYDSFAALLLLKAKSFEVVLSNGEAWHKLHNAQRRLLNKLDRTQLCALVDVFLTQLTLGGDE
jgi:hypothetical protein